MSNIIVISGMVGAGKSTFIDNYSKHLTDNYLVSVKKFLEPVDNNELLPLMYANPTRWTYTAQVRFLVDKLNSLRKALECDCSVILIERSYAEHRVFAMAQRSMNRMTQIEYDSYMELYEACESFIPESLDYHISLPYDECLRRIKKRGRSYELTESLDYYEALYEAYSAVYSDHLENLVITDTLGAGTYRRLDNFTLKGMNIYG